MIYNIHAGHGISNGNGCGAVGILDESKEARLVKDRLIELLKLNNDTVYDCTYNGSASQNAILKDIVLKANAHKVDLDISIHLNSGRNDYVGNGVTGGTEVYGYDNSVADIGNKICKQICQDFGYTNRGFKTTKNLYVLNNTKSPAILIECCFVDDKDDANKWNANKCAESIFVALTGKSVSSLNAYDNLDLVFNYKYYSNSYIDLKRNFGEDKEKLKKHFIDCGMKEGRRGSYNFDVSYYKVNNKDLKNAFGNDLVSYYKHFMTNGYKEGRKGANYSVYNGINYSLVYDKDYYLNKYSDLKNKIGNNAEELIKHFVNNGMKEGRQAISTFNVKKYKERYSDLQRTFGDNYKSYYMHYITYGYNEKRKGV